MIVLPSLLVRLHVRSHVFFKVAISIFFVMTHCEVPPSFVVAIRVPFGHKDITIYPKCLTGVVDFGGHLLRDLQNLPIDLFTPPLGLGYLPSPFLG